MNKNSLQQKRNVEKLLSKTEKNNENLFFVTVTVSPWYNEAAKHF